MKKIIITGANGFVGSYVVEQALADGYEVWAAVRRGADLRYLTDERIHLLYLDYADEEGMRQIFSDQLRTEGPLDGVIHCAGATKCRHLADFKRINTEYTERLARLLVETGLLRGRFVYVSSLSVFGPIHEDDNRPYTAQDTPHPNTAYGRSKLDAETALPAIVGLDHIILRPTGVYGPREHDYYKMAKSIAMGIDFAVGFKPQTITFIYVKDLAAAALAALQYGLTGAAYNLSDGCDYNSRDYSDLLQKEIGAKSVLHLKAPLWVLKAACFVSETVAGFSGKAATLNGDKYRILRQRNWRCDIRPAQDELHYRPQYTLAQGVKETVGWYLENGWL